jgi:hypothetical protein
LSVFGKKVLWQNPMAEDESLVSQKAFWEQLNENISALSVVESKICSKLMQGLDFEEEAKFVVETLVYHVTTEYPVSEEEGYDEQAASLLIEKAQVVSEKFMEFYEVLKKKKKKKKGKKKTFLSFAP